MGNYKIYIKEKVLKIYAAQTVHCALVDIQFFCGICQKKKKKRKANLFVILFLFTEPFPQHLLSKTLHTLMIHLYIDDVQTIVFKWATATTEQLCHLPKPALPDA